MKLVIATPLYPPEIGGPATYANLLKVGLPEKGIDVEVVKFSDVRHLPKLIRHYVYYRRILHAARGADAILALDPVSVGLPAMKAAKKAGKTFLVKIVGDYAWEQGQQRFGVTESLDEFARSSRGSFPARILRKIQTHVARSAVRIIVPSEYLKTIVVAWGIPETKIQVIYNAVPRGGIGSVPGILRERKQSLVVTAGRLVPWKHVDGILEAVELVRKKTASVSLVVVGDGPDRRKLERQARILGEDCIFTGRLPHADTLAVIKDSAMFVLNSSYEGFSHLLVEALAVGAPVIATCAGGNAEIVEHERNGLLIPVGDTEALAKAIERFICDVPFAEKMRENAPQSVARFSPETMMERTAALIIAS